MFVFSWDLNSQAASFYLCQCNYSIDWVRIEICPAQMLSGRQKDYEEYHSVLVLIAEVAKKSSSHFYSCIGFVGNGIRLWVSEMRLLITKKHLCDVKCCLISLWLIFWYVFKPGFFSMHGYNQFIHICGNCLSQRTLTRDSNSQHCWCVFIFFLFNLSFCNHHKYNSAVHSQGKLNFTPRTASL